MTRTTASSKFGLGRLLVALMVAAFAIGGLAQQAQADTILFNPAGADSAANTTLQAGSFDWFPGSALASNFNTNGGPVAGTTFQLYYQSFLSGIGTTGGPNTALINTGLQSPATLGDVIVNNAGTLIDTNQAFTIVAGFTETVTGTQDIFNPTTGRTERTISFGILPSTPPNFVNIYAVRPGTFDVRAGTGFAQNGTAPSGGPNPILTAQLTTTGFSASFKQTGTGTGAQFVPDIGRFNTFNADDAGITSIQGNGSTNLTAIVSSVNSAYFPGGVTGLQLNFQTTNSLPFTSTTPSLLFYNGTATIARNIDGVNGAGPSIEFQADVSNNFTVAAVPEPGSVTMALTGLGFLSLVGLRARRRRS